MNDERRKTLIVVEGKHEKTTLIKLLLKCFPRLDINYNDVEIFGADVYDFYSNIEDEYGQDWYTDNLVIDVPYLISKRNSIEPPLQRKNFTNIILVFDYERQDPSFCQVKIERLQQHFNDVSDDGVLYVNYPMIESYLDMDKIPDRAYKNKKVSTYNLSGKDYKQKVRESSALLKYIKAYELVEEIIDKSFLDIDSEEREAIIADILSIRSDYNLEQAIEDVLPKKECFCKNVCTCKFYIASKMRELDYLHDDIDFWTKLRQIFAYVMKENLKKIWCVENEKNEIGALKIRYIYDNINLKDLLKVQGIVSQDETNGFIWVVCTFMIFCGEYKFFWENNYLDSIQGC